MLQLTSIKLFSRPVSTASCFHAQADRHDDQTRSNTAFYASISLCFTTLWPKPFCNLVSVTVSYADFWFGNVAVVDVKLWFETYNFWDLAIRQFLNGSHIKPLDSRILILIIYNLSSTWYSTSLEWTESKENRTIWGLVRAKKSFLYTAVTHHVILVLWVSLKSPIYNFSSKSVNCTMRYGDLMIIKMAAVAFKFRKFKNHYLPQVTTGKCWLLDFRECCHFDYH